MLKFLEKKKINPSKLFKEKKNNRKQLATEMRINICN